jgi:Carboxypeptidase regulatory-like domain
VGFGSGLAHSARGALAVFVLVLTVSALLALPIGSTASAAGEGSGEIGGQVTDSATSAPLAGIEVCAYAFESEAFEEGVLETETEGSPSDCASTGADGLYAISDLPSGEYAVEFSSPAESGLNYVTQYFDGKASPEEAQPVAVAAGELTPGIDAELQEGGRVAGRVTSAATSAALERVLVCALPSDGSESGCTFTNADGEYTISALAGGPYKVGFVAAAYAAQFYDDKPTYSAAQFVLVSAGDTTPSIDGALTPAPTPASHGEGSTRVLGEARRGLRATPLLALTAAKVVVSGSSGSARVECEQARCAGLLELATRIEVRRRGEHGTVTAKRRVVLARGSFSLGEGASATVILHLTGDGKRRLAHAKRHPLAARLIARLKDGSTVSKSLLVS